MSPARGNRSRPADRHHPAGVLTGQDDALCNWNGDDVKGASHKKGRRAAADTGAWISFPVTAGLYIKSGNDEKGCYAVFMK